MKYVIALIAVVVIILALFGFLHVKVSPSSNSDGSKENVESDEWEVVNVVLIRGNSPKEVIGANLPKSAQEVHYEILLDTTCTKFNWIVAKLPKEDFDKLMNQLELTNEPGLLTIWPEAFSCE